MKQNKKNIVWSLVLLAMVILWPDTSLFAAEPGSFSVRGGPLLMKTKNIKGNFKLNDNLVPGTTLTVDDVNHYGLFLNWSLTRNISLETVVSTPIPLDIFASGPAVGGEIKAAEVDLMMLVLLARYGPEKDWHGFRPYVGLGAAYYWTDNEETTAGFDTLLETAVPGIDTTSPRFDIDSKLHPVVELGVDYMLGENWFVNASWLYFEGKNDISIDYSGGAILASKVSYDPQIYSLTLGYQF